MNTVNAVAIAGLVDVATQLGLAGQMAPAGGALVVAAGFGFFLWRGFRRIRRLDAFEDKIRG
jgi:hypothetical protein